MPKSNVRTALQNLAAAFNHYNENHPHSALGYHSLREYLRLRASLTEDTKLSGYGGSRSRHSSGVPCVTVQQADDIRNLPMFSSPIQLGSGWTLIHD